MFNSSLSQGLFPDQWKLAHVTPIHKSGSVDDAANYRPVSILSACGKILESIVQKKMFAHFQNALDDNQHGFRPKKSVWNPFYKIHSDRTEGVQKRFLYHLCYSDKGCHVLNSYNSRLCYYKMQSLCARRKSLDLMFLYKLINGFLDSPELFEKVNFSVPRNSSRLINRETFMSN